MGSRGRSIRLRIYFLVAIPLVMMVALAGVFSYTSVRNWLNLERAPKQINATSVPITQMTNLLQSERRAAFVYLSQPDGNNLRAYTASVAATRADTGSLTAALNSPSTKSSENVQEANAINRLVTDVNGLSGLRQLVQAKKVPSLKAFAAYTKVITESPAVYQAMATSLSDPRVASQGLALIGTVNSHEDLSEQDTMVAGALAAGSITPAERVAFSQAAGRQQDATLQFTSLFTRSAVSAFTATQNKLAPQTVQAHVTSVQQAVEGGATVAQLEARGINSVTWKQLTSTLINAHYRAGLAAAANALATDQQIINNFKTRVYILAAVGVAGLLFTLIVTMLLARSVNSRLTRLRRNAVVLATEHLPNIVARLRRGEQVDIAASAPPLRVGSDEIGQVGQAFDMVRQTALRSAVEESRLRQGVNDMFRNLARRNQSLLQRQLSMLDGMERRAADPDVLDDLFKMDHLTTRMRRHAEGLIILSGAAPGRGWSTPVKLIDVMRGAVAEVEDFARVIVTTQSRAALTGGAVTDVIHLLAELIENATTLSPPFTQVRVHGEMVANGFAIEIEDRGLGMTPMRMGELNERLANPPDVNPANTEQLGLFVVGQLARRHSINVALRPSPYGGTTAIVMIPQRLVVDDSTPAIGTGTGPQAAAHTGPQPAAAGRAANGGTAVPGGFPGASAPGGAHTPSAGFPRAGFGSGGPPDLDSIPLSSPFASPAPSANGSGAGFGGDPSGHSGPGGHGGPNMPGRSVLTGVPLGRPASQPPMGGARQSQGYSSSSFYGNGNGNGAPAGQNGPGTGPFPGLGGPGGMPNTGPNSYGSNSPDSPNGYGSNAGPDNGYESMDPGSSDTDAFKGLPRRVRQANLAPQLRKSEGGTGAPQGQATAQNPADVKNTFSAMQRGWRQGRSQNLRDNGGH